MYLWNVRRMCVCPMTVSGQKKRFLICLLYTSIRNYQESMFMGLNLRQCIFSLLAILVAVGIYFGLGDYVGQEMTGWLCILGAAPFAACGFFQYHGMNAEQFAWAYIKSEFLYPKRLLFQSEDLYHACMEAVSYTHLPMQYVPISRGWTKGSAKWNFYKRKGSRPGKD